MNWRKFAPKTGKCKKYKNRMMLYTVTGVITMMVSIISCVIGLCIAELIGLKELDRLWVVIPLAVIGTSIGAWIESKRYKY